MTYLEGSLPFGNKADYLPGRDKFALLRGRPVAVLGLNCSLVAYLAL